MDAGVDEDMARARVLGGGYLRSGVVSARMVGGGGRRSMSEEKTGRGHISRGWRFRWTVEAWVAEAGHRCDASARNCQYL